MKLKSLTHDLHVYLDSLALEKDITKKEKLSTQITNIQNSIKDFGKQKKEINLKSIEEIVVKKYNEQKKELDDKTKLLKNEETIINQNKKLYSSMRGSLIKALTSKKKLM